MVHWSPDEFLSNKLFMEKKNIAVKPACCRRLNSSKTVQEGKLRRETKPVPVLYNNMLVDTG